MRQHLPIAKICICNVARKTFATFKERLSKAMDRKESSWENWLALFLKCKADSSVQKPEA